MPDGRAVPTPLRGPAVPRFWNLQGRHLVRRAGAGYPLARDLGAAAVRSRRRAGCHGIGVTTDGTSVRPQSSASSPGRGAAARC
jgi:hypothetical protein